MGYIGRRTLHVPWNVSRLHLGNYYPYKEICAYYTNAKSGKQHTIGDALAYWNPLTGVSFVSLQCRSYSATGPAFSNDEGICIDSVRDVTGNALCSKLSTLSSKPMPSDNLNGILHPNIETANPESEREESHSCAADAAFQLQEGETIDWNNKQLCRLSHRNLLLYLYNNVDMATVVKITNQVLAPYQTLPKRKKASQRRQYLQKFLRCIRKHQPLEDHVQLGKWMIRSIDLLTCDDLYSMLRVRHILNYDNSFETFRASFGMENFETFSNVRSNKVLQEKIIGEQAIKSRTAQRNLLMRHLKINKFRFLKDQNVTKAVYEANIEWSDNTVEMSPLNAENYAFIYNLPFIDEEELNQALSDVLSRFAKVKKIEILFDRLPPLTSFVKRASIPRHVAPPPRDKYSPLYALVGKLMKRGDNISDRVRKMELALQFVANTLVEQTNVEVNSGTNTIKTIQPMDIFKVTNEVESLGTNSLVGDCKKGMVMPDGDIAYTNTLLCSTGLLPTGEAPRPPSECKIMASYKRKRISSGNNTVVTANTYTASITTDWPSITQVNLDNHVDPSMLDQLANKSRMHGRMDPQWIVLRFPTFKHAYFARKRLMLKFVDEPRSIVSFDTKRSIFHNG
uniref:Uncharacterized protein n=1 Tax=Babesia bovis TaxID=5865 RepID=A7ASY5_BABBO|eukprot:XP_001609614.1 hypothetical protein [Babesia bovis T2Bo]